MPEDFLPRVYCNDSYLYQILSILLDNAIAYGCPPDGASEITLSASFRASTVVLSVIDHGPGIPDNEKPLVFDRFYRGDKSRNKKEHFGLGLSIADKLAGHLKIVVEAGDTEGGGTTFRVKLPVK